MSDQQTRTTSEPVRWGVLGVARIGMRAVVPALLAASNARIVALASRDQARAEAAIADLPGARAYGSYEALLDDPEAILDLILNLTITQRDRPSDWCQ
jgi:predicted dehydrogenase